MGHLPSLQVTVDTKGWSCIVDVRLALETRGPMLVLRMAEELGVFLVPSLWEVLDNTTYYEHHPERLYGDPLEEDVAHSDLPTLTPEQTGALAQWETARLEPSLSASIHWVGDHVYESSLPKDVDSGVVRRFERLVEGLAMRLASVRPEMEAGWPLLDGGRDAVALAAAMIRYRPVILTLSSCGKVPPLIRFLRICGIPCHNLDEQRASHPRMYLTPFLIRSGAMELTWDGLPLTAVHLVAPAAFLMPPLKQESEEPIDDLNGSANDWLYGAAAYWYELS